MIVPNYIPEPLEVPGNITLEPYPYRLIFVRRVTLLHLATFGIITLLAAYPWPHPPSPAPLIGLAALLLLLEAWRTATQRSRYEAMVSSAFLPLVLIIAGWGAAEATRFGFPVWAPATGVVAATAYTLVCGRDYSFVGNFVLSWIASTVAIAAIVRQFGLSPQDAKMAMVVNTAYLFYYLYDLASLLSRRRRGEELGAVVDLYRDVFNVFGYTVRVVRHWRKHHIWGLR